MKTLVTGAAGHIGINLVRLLLAEGRKVKALLYKDTKPLAEVDTEEVSCDITKQAEVEKALEDVDIVYHCAAKIAISRRMEKGMLAVNIEGTHKLLQVALKQKIKKFVHFSSIHALCSEPEDEVLDENRPLVNSKNGMLYDFSKAEAERLVLAAVKKGLPAVIVSPTAVIGPYDYKPSLLGQFILTLIRGKMLALVKGGFNWVDVRDVAQAALAAEKKGRIGERYLLAGNWASITRLAELVCGFCQQKRPSLILPDWLAKIGIPFVALAASLKGQQPLYTKDSLHTLKHHRYISSAKANKELGYTTRSLEITIKDTLQWFTERGYLNEFTYKF